MKLLFAWRYFKSKKSTNAINIIAWISVVAITVGTAALIIVLSVFNGFEGLVQSLYSDFYSDIRITPASGKFFHVTAQQLQRMKETPGVVQITRTVEEKAALVNGEAKTIVSLKGIDSNYAVVNRLQVHIKRGEYAMGNAETPSLVIGVGIENAVAVDPSSPESPDITVYLPNRATGAAGGQEGMLSAPIHVSGAFMVQQEFDNKYAFTNLDFMQYMLNLKPEQYSGIELKVANTGEVERVSTELKKRLGKGFTVRTRLEQNQSLFTVMTVEKWVIYAILSLILVVAAFNMIGALTMLVMEKQKDTAVLKAMGANEQLIQGIFLSEGFLLAGIGGLAGMVLAYLVCYVQLTFKIIKLEGGTFIINYYPVKMTPADFILVTATVAFITVLAAFLPARKAATQQFSLKS
ncbi:FtsX-like permease family protein [Deminuibacter soli]|uniref:ABC transporter permease n=1 Tax=Deminuibacter soli TaxID=2291815 RepID=A0A3E1NP60_9BACT|nr:FtsX-like permease family protein [Deminuibacter soli]RFM29721.1 ABC transporter permease [Deminuibacter soli]